MTRAFILMFLMIGFGALAMILIKPIEVDKINGVSLVSPPNPIDMETMGEVKRINASWVAVIPYGFSQSGKPGVTFDYSRQWWGERTDGTCKLIEYAKSNGLKVMLKPHVWVMDEGWTGDFNLASEVEWKQWEADFMSYILNHATIANSMAVDVFCIGTEYRIPARERPEFWKKLVGEVKKIY